MILPERTRHGFLLASMSVQEGDKPNNVLSAFPGILSRAWSVGGTEDLSALQAPWLQAGRFLREVNLSHSMPHGTQAVGGFCSICAL